MASNPPFELEDQTDEDFFDKLVDDDDDEDVISKNVKFIKADDVFDGNESDEAKAFSNLSVGEISRGNSGSELAGDKVSDDNPSVEAREEHIVDGEANSSSLSSDLPFLENGQVSNNGLAIFEGNSDLDLRRENSCSSNGAVKEVQWSAFTESAMPGIRGVGSYDDFFTDLGEGNTESIQTEVKDMPVNGTSKNAIMESSFTHIVSQGATGASIEQPAVEGDTYSIDYWERLYPGWKYDPNTGQWYHLYSNDGTATFDVQSSQVYYAQQMAQSVSNQISTTENVSGWNHILHQNGNNQYPAHMIFDPNYPGWYYDTIAQQWLSLEAYHASIQSTDSTCNQQAQNEFLPLAGHPHSSSLGTANYGQQSPGSEGLKDNLGNYGQQGATAHFGLVNRSTASPSLSQPWKSSGDLNIYTNQMSHNIPSDSTGAISTREKAGQSKDNNYSNWVSGVNNFPADKDFQRFNHAQEVQQVGPAQYPADYYISQQTNAFVQPLSSNSHHGSFSPSDGRSSASRPPHALVAFGFGGKLLVMRDNNCGGFSTYRSKNIEERFLSVYNLMEVVSLNNGPSTADIETHSYFHSLCHQSFPGPLVGNVGSKELNKWVDERIACCESLGMNNGKGQGSKLLLSLLKIACQHYGKLRSFGGDTGLKENDNPESAVAKLFASSKGYDGQFGGSHAISRCLMTLPSEAHMQTTAAEVQNLLISGRKMEALQRAQEGQFWGFALILSRELGEQFYADTVKQMAVSQLVIGSPLRTLCLLIAKKPEEVFSNSIVSGNVFGAVPTSPKSVQNAGCSMLDNWEENLAVITSNRTENDHLVIIHLGDCLLKEKNNVAAAHICYLVAEAGFELYSDSARLCLIGADHWNFPRTYASPEAIQRTELFEYAKVLGNSQFILLQLQPYKLIYAHMLAEVGRVSDSLKYCQAVSKSLKNGRSPEADTLKQLLSSLEERIRAYQQSGYVANLAPAKIVGKLLNFIDSTAHRVVGGLPPSGPSPSTTQSTFQGNENQFQTFQASMNLTSSQSTMGMSSLTPSASMEPISQWAIDQSKMTLQNRSISEPDIGRTPKPDQADSSIEATSSSTVGKQSGSTGTSRFGRFNFGAQILQKTVGLVLKPRQGRQAKLGDANKFYYDEKLKRWVEEGAEPAPEESALPPPPTTATFQNGKSDYNLKNALNDGLHAINSSPGSINSTPESSPGLPSTLPSSNQFSARGRMGVRSRYVDTFNKGGGASTNQFQAPSVPSAKPSSLTSGAKFFIPSAALTHDQTLATEAGSSDEVYESGESPSSSKNDPFQNLAPAPMGTSKNDPFQNLAPAPMGTMQRFPSVGNIPTKGTMENGKSPLPPPSRRAASWSAIQSDMYSRPPTSEMKASPLSFMPSSGQLPGNLHMDRNNSGDDLQEVEL